MTKTKIKKKVTPKKPIPVLQQHPLETKSKGLFERIWKWLKDRIK